MQSRNRISTKTRSFWTIDSILAASAILASLTGIYFLYFPYGGYQGGRNPTYGITFLFDRTTWDVLHTWTGVTMIAVVVIHLLLHWKWVVNRTIQTFKGLTGQLACVNRGAQFNFWLNVTIAATFLLTAISGIYFLFFPGGNGYTDPYLLFNRTTWDMIHTWSAVAMIVAAITHFAIHWRWITNVTGKIFRGASSSEVSQADINIQDTVPECETEL